DSKETTEQRRSCASCALQRKRPSSGLSSLSAHFDVLSLQQKAVSARVGLDLDLETLPDELLGECKSMEAYARLGDFSRSLACADRLKNKRRRFVQGGKAQPGTDGHGRRSLRRG
ncbi:hypothetical protein KI387_024790, partial [Taxus chinensis]